MRGGREMEPRNSQQNQRMLMKATETIGTLLKAIVACLAVAGLGLYPFSRSNGRHQAAVRASQGQTPFVTGC